MNHNFTNTNDFVFDTFEQMIQEFEQNPSISSFEKLETYFNIVRNTFRLVNWICGHGEYRYFSLKQNFEKIKSMMEEAERQRMIEAMKATPGINNRYNL